MRRYVRWPIFVLSLSELLFVVLPSAASARYISTTMHQAPGPAFAFPTDGTTYPAKGPYQFQVQPINGATGYLWSFVEGGMIVYQNLAWEGHLSPASYTVAMGSKAHRLIRPGDLHVWVRALMKNGQWSATSGLAVRIQRNGPPSTQQPNVLYQANWSGGFNGWTASPDWKTVSGQLVNDGTNDDATQFAHPPEITPYTANYAVEAEIQYVRDGYGCYPPADYGYVAFGLSVRGESSGDYRVGIVHRYGTIAAFIFDHGSSDTCPNFYPPLAKASYSLDMNWHTYRVEVRGNDIKLLIDGQSVIEAIDNHHLTSNSVGLWSTGTVLNVRSFKVIAL